MIVVQMSFGAVDAATSALQTLAGQAQSQRSRVEVAAEDAAKALLQALQ
jgi:hypothetical protein|eukprot:COSAG01_NODE_39073_length_481_cov_1.125654_1_plen_49_part_00